MRRTEMLIGTILRSGLWLSVLVVLIGGVMYLVQYGQDPIHYGVFQHDKQALNSMSDIFHDALSLSSRGIIQLGLLILVITQMLRVAMTAILFVQVREKWFALISLLILAILIYSVFWRN